MKSFGQTPSAPKRGIKGLTWFLLVLGLILSIASPISGLLFVAGGLFLRLKYVTPKADKPIYKQKFPVTISILWVVLTALGLSVPGPEAITSLTLNCEPAIQIDIKDNTSIPITFESPEASTSYINFYTSDPKILSFAAGEQNGDFVGIVTPKSEGTAAVKIYVGDVESKTVQVTVIDSERIAAEEAARKAAEEEAARKAAEEEAARKAAEEEAARKAAEEEAARKAAEEEAAHKAAEEEAARKAAEQKAAQEKADTQSTANGQMVWISGKGKKYHSDPNCSNMKNPSQISISQAQSKGYTPCKKCY